MTVTPESRRIADYLWSVKDVAPPDLALWFDEMAMAALDVDAYTRAYPASYWRDQFRRVAAEEETAAIAHAHRVGAKTLRHCAGRLRSVVDAAVDADPAAKSSERMAGINEAVEWMLAEAERVEEMR